MKKIYINILLVVFSSAIDIPYYDPNSCGMETTYESFQLTDEFNNTGNPTHLAPWGVIIRIGYSDAEVGGQIICGGTLITKKHVLTAAHCFRDRFADKKYGELIHRYCDSESKFDDNEILESTTVQVGAICNKLDSNVGCIKEPMLGKNLSITRFSYNTFFENNCENGHDIAILELNETISDIEAANHICLPFLTNITIPSNTPVYSFGWGSDPGKAYDTMPYPLIQVIELQAIPFEECNEKWAHKIPSDSYCTDEEEDKNVCSGDSGGGITYEIPNSTRKILAGVVSYGTDCSKLLLGTKPRAQINTDVRKHEEFILDFINS